MRDLGGRRNALRLLTLGAIALSLGGVGALTQAGHAAPADDAPMLEMSQPVSPVETRPEAQASSATVLPPPTTSPPPAPTPAPSPAPAPGPAAPAPAAAAAAPQTPGPASLAEIEAVFADVVPAAWRQAIATRFRLIDGGSSWANPNGLIEIGSYHASHGDATLRVTIAHEFGHLIAFHYGTHEFDGAAPVGWPSYSGRPEEAWADCVATALTGLSDPSHGLPPCVDPALAWTAAWLEQGPGAHPRTW